MTGEKNPHSKSAADLAYRVSFVNRHELRTELREEIVSHLRTDEYKKVILIYGQKGIGKTSLLNFAYKESKKDKELNIIRIFNPHVNNTFLNDVRSQIMEDCALFDYASTKIDPSYKQAIKQKRKNRTKLIGYILFGLSGPIIELAYSITDSIRSLFRNNRYRGECGLIDEAARTSGKLHYMLQDILAKDINFLTTKHKKKFVFLVDIEDTRLEYAASKKWLWELVKQLKSGLVIVATQENIKLEINVDCTHLVTRLDDSYVEEILDTNNIRDEMVRKCIVDASAGIPLEVHQRIEKYYELRKDSKYVDLEVLSSSLKDIALDTLNNLQSGVQALVVSISVFRIFNKRIYSELCRILGIHEGDKPFSQFVQLTLIERCADSDEFFQLKCHYWDYGFENELGSEEVRRFLDLYGKHFSAPFIDELGRDILVRVYENSLKLEIEHHNESNLLKTSCLDISYCMYNRGLWFEMLEGLNLVDGTPLENGSIYQFISGHALRKIDSSEAGARCLNTICDTELIDSDYYQTAQTELTYIDCLEGNYDRAFEGFARDYDWVIKNSKDPNDPRYFKMYLNYADIIFLKGDFIESAILTHNLKNSVEQYRGPQFVETIRNLGHVYRFNLMHDQAEEQYLKALGYAQGNDALLAKLHTNLAETLAVTAHKSAVKFGEQALEENKMLGAVFEIGKVNAALGIAYLLYERYDDALDAIRQCKRIQTNASYPAGVLFGLVSEFLFYTSLRDERRKEKIAMEILKLSKKINVYKYLYLYPALELGQSSMVERIVSENRWINEDIINAHTATLNKVSR